MCDDGIDQDMYAGLQSAYGALHAAARRVLASAKNPASAEAAQDLLALQHATAQEPAAFRALAPAAYRITLARAVPQRSVSPSA